MPFSGEKLHETDSRIDLKKVERMAEDDRNHHKSRSKRDGNPSNARRPRSIRFSDS